jgi:AraC-like DNA-binding protein
LEVDRARTLLRRNDTPIADIAAQVGYNSSQALAQAFRREVGFNRRGR